MMNIDLKSKTFTKNYDKLLGIKTKHLDDKKIIKLYLDDLVLEITAEKINDSYKMISINEIENIKGVPNSTININGYNISISLIDNNLTVYSVSFEQNKLKFKPIFNFFF